MTTILGLTDEDIRHTWHQWEESDWIQPVMDAWLEMCYQERMAFFLGLVLPERYGPPAHWVTLARVYSLNLISRHPEGVAP
jgi:hypothetical protein